jgi:hypothetical protein
VSGLWKTQRMGARGGAAGVKLIRRWWRDKRWPLVWRKTLIAEHDRAFRASKAQREAYDKRLDEIRRAVVPLIEAMRPAPIAVNVSVMDYRSDGPPIMPDWRIEEPRARRWGHPDVRFCVTMSGQMLSEIPMGLDRERFSEVIEAMVTERILAEMERAHLMVPR